MVRTIAAVAILSLPTWAENVPVREASSPAIINGRMPAFYNGYLYSCEPHNIATIFAPDGHVLLTLPMQGAGNGKTSILAIAIDSDGTLAISWRDPPSAGIDIRDTTGKLVRTIETGRYVPAHLSFGQDHSLWVFGSQRDAVNQIYADKVDYPTVRKYSIDGHPSGAFLLRSLFPQGLEPGGEHWQSRRITVTADRVGIEAISGNVSNQREWVELDLNGNLIGRWRLDPRDRFPGVVLTSDNRVYVHRLNEKIRRHVFRLSRESSIWEPVNALDTELYGADGDKLVFAKWTANTMQMEWYPQP